MSPIHALRLAAFAAVSAGVAGLAAAQTSTRPNDARPSAEDPSTRPQVTSPYWTQDAGPAMPAPGEYRGPQNPDEFMAATVMAVPGAAAEAIAARWQMRRVDNELNRTSNALRRDFTESEEYAQAVGELRDAYAALESARGDATRDLVGTAEYQASTELRKNVTEQIADERDQDEPSLDRLAALAALKVDYVAPLRQTERETLARDSAVRAAKDRLVAAARAVSRLEKDFARDVRDSIELADIRKTKEEARINKLAATAYVNEARLAREIAIRYAYVSRGLIRLDGNGLRGRSGYGGYDGYGYGGGYGGYGYGYGSGFYVGGVNYGTGLASGVRGGSGFGAGSNAFIGTGVGGGNNAGSPGRTVNRPGNREFNPFGNGRTSYDPFGNSPARYNPFGSSGGFFNPNTGGVRPAATVGGGRGSINAGSNAVGGRGGNAFVGPRGNR